MADNVTIPATGSGSATPAVATDDVGGSHYQKVKIADGAADSSAMIGGDATNGLDVDVTRVVPGTGATNLGKAEDAAHTTGDVGVMPLGVRNDAGAALAADGDYIPFSMDPSGNLRVNVAAGGTSGTQYTEGDTDASITGTAAMWEDSADTLRAVSMAKPLPVQPGTAVAFPVTDNGGSLTVDNGGAFAVQENGAALTALQLIDDLVLAEDAAHQTGDAGVQMLAVRDDTLNARSGAENDYEPLHTDANGALWTQDVNSAAQAASLSVLDDWDETDRCKVNLIAGQAGITAGAGAVAANTPRITHASDDPVTTALQIMDDWDNGASDGASVSGDVAHDAADAGEPVKIGHKAVDLGANPTDVAANDRTNWYAMRNGVPFVIGGAPFVKSQNLQVTDADGAQTDTAIITANANVAIIVTAIEVCADNANTVNVSCRIGFGTANTPGVDADKVIMFHPGIAPGSGLVKGDGSGIIGAGLSGEDLRVTCADPVTGSLSITVTYFTLAIA